MKAIHVNCSQQSVTIENPTVFAALRPDLAEQFLSACFGLPETYAAVLEPDHHRCRLEFATRADTHACLAAIAAAIDRQGKAFDLPVPLPRLVNVWGQPLRLQRWQQLVTFLDIQSIGPNKISIHHPEIIKAKASRSKPFIEMMSRLPGVKKASFSRLGQRLVIRHDRNLALEPLLRKIESLLTDPSVSNYPLVPYAKVPFAGANLNFVLCGAGQFMYPPLIPAASLVLVLTRLPLLGEVGREAMRGKLGAPFFQSVVLACSVATAAPFASALAEWLGCFWKRKWQREVTHEARKLTHDIYAARTDLITQNPPVASPDQNPVGESQSTVPSVMADGQQRWLEGNSGQEHLEQRVAGLATHLAKDGYLKQEARKSSDWTVLPNLAIAGLATSTGGLHMASAVLHQDWITGPGIISPTQFFVDMRSALKTGALITSTSALDRLAACRVILIDASAVTPIEDDAEASQPSGIQATAADIDELKKLGYSVVWIEDGNPATDSSAAAYAADLLAPTMTAEQKARFIQMLTAMKLPTAYIGSRPLLPAANALTICDYQPDAASDADIELVSHRLSALVATSGIARSHQKEARSNGKASALANIACILGAFTGSLNGTTSTLLAHLGVMTVSGRQAYRLRTGS
jgi:hypothetical protein